MEWKTIDSAPRDGETAVDLWFPDHGRKTNWRWYKKHGYWGSIPRDRFCAIEVSVRGEPTHWMPPPATGQRMTDPAIIRALIDGWLNVAIRAEADAKHSEACEFTVMAEQNWKTHQHAMLQADVLEQVLTRRKGDEA